MGLARFTTKACRLLGVFCSEATRLVIVSFIWSTGLGEQVLWKGREAYVGMYLVFRYLAWRVGAWSLGGVWRL